MGSKGIHDNWSRNRKERNTKRIGIQISNQNNIADDITRDHKKDSIVYNYNETIFERGKLWFNEGLSLDDAPDNLKTSVSFVTGYNKAKREQYVNNLTYQAGIEYYDKGIPFEEVPIIYKNNPFFIDGYNYAKSDKTLGK